MARLGTIQNAALRVCLGVNRSSPIAAIQAESSQPPLHLLSRRQLDVFLTSLLFWHPDHRLVAKLRDSNNRSAISNFFREESTARLAVPQPLHRAVATWLLPTPRVVLSHSGLPERAVSTWPALAINQVFAASVYNLHVPGVPVYTDGSLDPDSGSGGAAFHVPHLNFSQGFHLQGATSSTMTELLAIQMALAWSLNNLVGDLIIFTDSRSAIQSVISPQSSWKDVHLISDILLMMSSFLHCGRKVAFIWVPAHAGISPNEVADMVANRARDPSFAVATISCLEQLSFLKKRANLHHDNLWRDALQVPLARTHRGLIELSVHPPPSIPSRRFETSYHRLRVGTAYTNSYLFRIGKAASPLCSFCDSKDTIEHFLLQCHAFDDIRSQLANTLCSLGLGQPTLQTVLGHHGEPKTGRAALAALLNFLRLSGRYV